MVSVCEIKNILPDSLIHYQMQISLFLNVQYNFQQFAISSLLK